MNRVDLYQEMLKAVVEKAELPEGRQLEIPEDLVPGDFVNILHDLKEALSDNAILHDWIEVIKEKWEQIVSDEEMLD